MTDNIEQALLEHKELVRKNTPRTRNRIFDMTAVVASYIPNPGKSGRIRDEAKEGWTFRKKLEAEFQEMGLRSERFSHAKEPDDRIADALRLSWDSYNSPGGRRSSHIEYMEVYVTFTRGFVVSNIFYYIRNGGCFARRSGSVTIKESTSSSDALMAYVRHVFAKSN